MVACALNIMTARGGGGVSWLRFVPDRHARTSYAVKSVRTTVATLPQGDVHKASEARTTSTVSDRW
jgi:hypothetical protein